MEQVPYFEGWGVDAKSLGVKARQTERQTQTDTKHTGLAARNPFSENLWDWNSIHKSEHWGLVLLQQRSGGPCYHGEGETCDLGCKFCLTLWVWIEKCKFACRANKLLLVKCYDNKMVKLPLNLIILIWSSLRQQTNFFNVCHTCHSKIGRINEIVAH